MSKQTRSNSIAPRRARILDVLREAGDPLQIREIVERTDLDYDNARSALSEMTVLGLLVRINRGVYDLPERAGEYAGPSQSETLQKILQNQQILNVLLNIIITNKALMEALLLGQQEIIRTLRSLRPATAEGQTAIDDLEQAFTDRVEWHFNVAAHQVVEQYTKLPPEVLDVLVMPLARDLDKHEESSGTQPGHRRARAGRKARH